jgi:hypothetical protein
VRTDGKVIVELHWALTGKHWPFPFDFERLQARLISVLCGGATILSFPPEDLLLFLCVHGSRHQWERLTWICDVAELVRAHQQIDWQGLLEQAEMSGAKRMLLLGLFLANGLLGADLPEDVLQSTRDDLKVKLLAGQVQARLFAHATGLPQLADRSAFRTHAFLVKVRERLQDKIQYFVHYPFRLHTANLQYLFNTARVDKTDRMPLFLPPFLSSFYRQRLRPIQQVVQYVLRRVKALLKAP